MWLYQWCMQVIPIDGLKTSVDTIKGSVAFSWGGGSDDIADISWNVPTIVLRYPAIS